LRRAKQNFLHFSRWKARFGRRGQSWRTFV